MENTHDTAGGAQLSRSLLSRHMTMISIGGAVGAGLFVGSGVSIQQAGPGVLIAYALTAVIVIVVMRMLAEMSVTRPDTGTFAVYGRLVLGRQNRADGRRPAEGTAVRLFPGLTWAVLIALLGLYAVMIVLADSRVDALLALALTVAVSLVGRWLQRRQAPPADR
ncbi:hypothetical protein TR51_11655 [Kitasatospora griseola]|uniref:Amino acid permease/ SLC12A domain-containing protein n=1 Tax=Kitasatospora griseola TaxID=2064 RepID=A0A0D0NZZ2_KITGR|nr:amino acid permease [Kitasatospora griseola]KIQ64796.1 hypothetical protein TR51_11655 [Kitasatospora griseola]